ncbi:MAG: pentapeptide repeat-containing protein, partial [Gammaproteobacteria bacterium]|nr:pentapeptide repeat-containing protein [Gammaproteobacteria bacterium]NIS49650.1 pentapeptide repeat-containing protein [Phycisphaerae bacterium]
MNGWKFLSPAGATEYMGKEFFYNLPAPGEKWSRITWHPDPIEEADGQDCGPGRLHVMKHFDVRYAPTNWWPWFCRGINVVGESHEKFGAQGVQLRRVSKKTYYYMLQRGYLSGANLSGATLYGADLSEANLTGANLYRANLSEANLSGADLTRANLYRANLSRANLSEANLSGADLTRAYLSGANLSGADLTRAYLSGANL